jgi:hypothetical protein
MEYKDGYWEANGVVPSHYPPKKPSAHSITYDKWTPIKEPFQKVSLLKQVKIKWFIEETKQVADP